jgi:hypothetical protein
VRGSAICGKMVYLFRGSHNAMMCRRSVVAIAILVFLGFTLKPVYGRMLDAKPDFREILQKMTGEGATSCDALGTGKEDVPGLEKAAFERAAELVELELDNPVTQEYSAKERADAALTKLQRESAEINAAWPDERRFHFQVLDLAPALLIKMTIRTRASYFVFGTPAVDDETKLPHSWRQAGDYGPESESLYLDVALELYPLHRGPSGNVRFLAVFTMLGCAGNTEGITYDAREWDPRGAPGYAQQIIKQEGAFGIDSNPSGRGPTAKDPFAPVGVLKTDGAMITLPYCWFSDLDTWDNPSLCAVDTYDLSGNAIRFVNRRYNRPDLVPVAKVLEYAEKHDYPEVRAYCVSDAVARKMMREGGYGFDTELETVRLGAGRERVRAAYSDDPGFVVEKRSGRWLVVSFDAD